MVQEGMSESSPHRLPSKLTCTKSLEFNVLGGKYNRGMSVPDSVSLILERSLGENEYFEAATLGWIVELFQAFFLVADDIMDHSETRRGNPCWYLNEGVGMLAINYASMLETGMYTLLKKYFSSHQRYVDMFQLLQETTHQTELGQLCDLIASEGQVDLEKFSMNNYRFIVTYKTAYYSFYLPIALALYQLDIATPINLKQAEDILIPLGEYFQIQDDYLDNYGEPKQTGKIGTDIRDNKCSWLIIQALALATPEQRQDLEDNYGRKDKTAETTVKRIFDELHLEDHFKELEEKQVNNIQAMISHLDESQGLKKSIFETFLAKIYKRTK
ncbi:Farnesyl pyrophosphate synthase [Fusarium sp. NRRL 52700]|nr:Farnesyl pyrophosphate synthase [Fusarium sp. NRRL 52700]